jgi:hypothetical protein
MDRFGQRAPPQHELTQKVRRFHPSACSRQLPPPAYRLWLWYFYINN